MCDSDNKKYLYAKRTEEVRSGKCEERGGFEKRLCLKSFDDPLPQPFSPFDKLRDREGEGSKMNRFESWSFSLDQNKLPYSKLVNIPGLLGVFRSTAASYKYIYFLSLLNILQETGFNSLKISLDDILLEMLAIAWFPHNYFKLNFGINDRITEELDRVELTGMEGRISNVKNSKSEIKAVTLPLRQAQGLMGEGSKNDLKGLKDAQRNGAIADLAASKIEERKPFYLFSEDRKSIIMNPNWMLYFYENQTVLRSFINWNWLEYMQKRNPSVPNLQLKLFPPLKRNNLGDQIVFWKSVCSPHPQPFSQKEKGERDLSIDHFLPRSFVAHDQLWNLIPVSKSINSSKSNNLPDLDSYSAGGCNNSGLVPCITRIMPLKAATLPNKNTPIFRLLLVEERVGDSYFEQFVDLQHVGLTTYRKNPGKLSWDKVVEPYVNDLKLSPEDVLDRDLLGKSLKRTIEPLSCLAVSQGFCEGWVYG